MAWSLASQAAEEYDCTEHGSYNFYLLPQWLEIISLHPRVCIQSCRNNEEWNTGNFLVRWRWWIISYPLLVPTGDSVQIQIIIKMCILHDILLFKSNMWSYSTVLFTMDLWIYVWIYGSFCSAAITPVKGVGYSESWLFQKGQWGNVIVPSARVNTNFWNHKVPEELQFLKNLMHHFLVSF